MGKSDIFIWYRLREDAGEKEFEWLLVLDC